MLDEYVNELKKRLSERREVADRMAIYDGGDVNRGMVQAYDAAMLDVDEIHEEFREPQEVPAHLKKAAHTVTMTTRGRA